MIMLFILTVCTQYCTLYCWSCHITVAAYRPKCITRVSPQEICNKLVTSPLQVFPKSVLPVFPQQVHSKLAWAKVHCVVSQIPLQWLVAGLLATSWYIKIVCSVTNKSATNWQLLHLQGTYGELYLGPISTVVSVLVLCSQSKCCSCRHSSRPS